MEGFLTYMGQAWPMAVCVLGFLRKTPTGIRYFFVLIVLAEFHTRGIQIKDTAISEPLVCGYVLLCPCAFTFNLGLNSVYLMVQQPAHRFVIPEKSHFLMLFFLGDIYLVPVQTRIRTLAPFVFPFA